MATIYRAVVETDPTQLGERAAGAFGVWLEEKYPGLTGRGLTQVARATSRGREGNVTEVVAWVEVDAAGDFAAWRGVLSETRGNERWTTTLTAIVEGEQGWLWVNNDQVLTNPFAPPPVPAAPRVLADLAAQVECWCGPTQVTARAVRVGADAVDELAEELFDPERTLALVVVSPRDHLDQVTAIERADAVAKRICGLGAVRVLTDAAVDRFAQRVGVLQVFDGAVRIYLPGIAPDDPHPYRHRYLRFHLLRGHAKQAANEVADALAHAAGAIDVPEVWRRRSRELPVFSGRAGRDQTEWIEHLESSNASLENDVKALQAQLVDAKRAAEDGDVELTEEQERNTKLSQQLDDARRRVSWYERQQTTGPTDADVAAPLPSIETSGGCFEVVESAAASLSDYLVIPDDVVEQAGDLDRYGRLSWVERLGRALLGLARYAKARQDGELDDQVNFHLFCRDIDASAECWPAKRVALRESDTVEQSSSMRNQRVLPVSAQVDRAGRVYMGAHLGIDRTPPAPHIRFHDDTNGPTRKVHVGFVGPHLDTASTN